MPLTNAWHLVNQAKAAEQPAVPEPVEGMDAGAGQSLINVNTAAKSELVSLPGIGPASADAIIDSRPHESVQGMIESANLTRLDETDVDIITNSVGF
ncbi:MAG: helix-hairpin-helix domain-containing protein [Cyanobacteria bacterium J06626_6]